MEQGNVYNQYFFKILYLNKNLWYNISENINISVKFYGGSQMSENISAEQYEAEIDALNRQLNSVRNKIMDSAYKDHYNPFENPTEYRHYNSDYSEIMPEIDEAFAEIPLNPQYRERRRLRRLYNITGIQLIFLMISSFAM